MALTPTGRNGAAMKQLWWIGIALVALDVSRGVTGQDLVNRERLEFVLRQSFSDLRSHEQQSKKEETREYITAFFKNLNASNFHRQDFEVNYGQGTFDGSNLIWVLPGQRFGTAEDAMIVIGAHYDSVTDSLGVDDDGSGMAALLEVAKGLSQQDKYNCTRLNSIVFAAFDWEEYGDHVGSVQFVDNYLVPDYLEAYGITPEKFQGAIILEGLLNWDDTPKSQELPQGFDTIFPELSAEVVAREYRGEFIVGAARQDDTQLATKVKEQWASMKDPTKYGLHMAILPFAGDPTKLPPQVQQGLSHLYRADHYSFWLHKSSYSQTGIKALFLTDTTEFRGYMKTCYHKLCDDLSHITEERLQFFHMIAEVTARVALETATEQDDLQCTGAPGVVAGGAKLCGQYHVTLLAFLVGCLMFRN